MKASDFFKNRRKPKAPPPRKVDIPQDHFDPVFLEITVDGKLLGRIVLKLYDDCPKTSYNFTCLCTGAKGIGSFSRRPLYFRGNLFHRIEPNFMI